MVTKSTTNQKTSSTKRGLQEGYDRVTYIIKDETAYKLNCIASIDNLYLKDVVNEALSQFIDEWEKKNGKVGKVKKK
jgi:hypothetical protein